METLPVGDAGIADSSNTTRVRILHLYLLGLRHLKLCLNGYTSRLQTRQLHESQLCWRQQDASQAQITNEARVLFGG
jgi:hypothetical protein